MITIKNDFLTVNILLKGAEVLSVINNQTGHNYMWEKDSSIWNNTSPVLFPTVGKSNGDKIRYKGKEYHFTNHGLARHHLFSKEFISPCEVNLTFNSYELEDDVFPFRFKFTVNYKLVNETLITTYKVSNPSNMENTYFSVGAHPAFRCPFDEKHTFEDYYIKFENDTTLTKHEITESALYTGKTSSFSLNDSKLDFATFDISLTPVFSDFKSNYVELCEKGSSRKIRCSIKGFPYVAFWKKPETNFVCIEPWCGKSDNVGFSGDFTEKNDIITVEPLESWEISYSTEFLYDRDSTRKNLIQIKPEIFPQSQTVTINGGNIKNNK